MAATLETAGDWLNRKVGSILDVVNWPVSYLCNLSAIRHKLWLLGLAVSSLWEAGHLYFEIRLQLLQDNCSIVIYNLLI